MCGPGSPASHQANVQTRKMSSLYQELWRQHFLEVCRVSKKYKKKDKNLVFSKDET